MQRYKITLLQTGNDSGEQNNKNRKILLKSHMWRHIDNEEFIEKNNGTSS